MCVPRAQNAFFLWMFALLVAGLFCILALFVLLPLSGDAGEINSAVPLPPVSEGYSTALRRDVELLKGQMNVLIAGAMETKIQRLESSLQSGIISATDLETIQELKESLKALKVYSIQNASATAGLQNDTEKAARATQPTHARALLYSDEVTHEIASIRNLVYVSIASWGFAIVVFGGVWLRGFYRLRRIQSEQWFRHQMLEKPKSRHY